MCGIFIHVAVMLQPKFHIYFVHAEVLSKTSLIRAMEDFITDFMTYTCKYGMFGINLTTVP